MILYISKFTVRLILEETENMARLPFTLLMFERQLGSYVLSSHKRLYYYYIGYWFY